MALPGVDPARVDPRLAAATDDFSSVLAATVEIGSGRVEPSHLLVALARIRGGIAESQLLGRGIPVDVLVEALRRDADQDGATVPIPASLEAATLSGPARELLDGIAAHPDTVDERTLLAAVVRHLEPGARSLLEEFGRIDVDAWSDELSGPPPPEIRVFDGRGELVEKALTPALRRVLAVVANEAADAGLARPGTVLLLYAMTEVPGALLEQAALFAGFDLHDVRSRARLLVHRGARRDSGTRERVVLRADTFAVAARTVLERAAVRASVRGAERVGEQDVVVELLRVRGGPAEGVLRASGIDPEALRHFADMLYTEAVPVEPGGDARPAASSVPVQEALDRFSSSLIGQKDVLKQLLPPIEMIKRAARRGFRMGERPLGTFLFCGPSGTGKTMTARLIAEAVYGSRDELIVFEMGQFNARESINNFIGAPPGYIGFGEGQLTNGLARKPQCVLLFDEVEKAHRLVFDALLRLLDEGRVNDPAGPVRDARDTVVVLTSNLAAREFADLGRLRLGEDLEPGGNALARALDAAFGASPAEGEPAVAAAADETQVRQRLRAVLEEFFRPEFLNRVDETVQFAPFGRAELAAIAEAGLRSRAEDVSSGLGVKLTWDDDVPAALVAQAAHHRADEAARGVNRCVDRVLAKILRELDRAEERGDGGVPELRVVVRDGEPDVVPDVRG